MNSEKELNVLGANYELIILDEPVHSVKDVQSICGCREEEVVKTLVFVGEKNLIILIPGNKKADLSKIRELIGDQELRMAKVEEVKAITNYSVGSVSPFGIDSDIKQIADSEILNLSFLYLGSGKSNVLVKITQSDFKKSFRGIFASISD
ncbi:MAG: YbaK/EbsC family protein [Minisyncoccus archaeiphilus]|uniref:aminoacyl-tRNA deacylase n=1 Tax=Minisyncoccus archaeiphilus TaxID=3238481 RepID=UPI002B0E0F39|nr:MAG: YbaK/EbsC family protein [Candidatus Parcubacteria bacterium]